MNFLLKKRWEAKKKKKWDLDSVRQKRRRFSELQEVKCVGEKG